MAPDQVASALGMSDTAWRGRERYRASYNVSPGQDTPVVRLAKGGTKQLHTMRWGLVPSFTKASEQRPDHYRMMNARSETVAEKGVFKRLLQRRRCLVPINGFYEWRQEVGTKQPYHVHLGSGTIMILAGLYDCWRRGLAAEDEEEAHSVGNTEGLDEQAEERGDVLYTYTVLTTTSSKAIQWLHDRMPVILPTPEAQDRWLSGDDCANLLCPYEGQDLAAYPVTPAMSKPGYQGSDACKELKRNTVLGMFEKAKACKGTPSHSSSKAALSPAGVPNSGATEDEGLNKLQGRALKRKEEQEGRGQQSSPRYSKQPRTAVVSPVSSRKGAMQKDTKQPSISSFFAKR